MTELKIHFNKNYTIWCSNGHQAEAIVDALRKKYSKEILTGEPTDVGVPVCPICDGELHEGAVNQ